VKPQKFCTGRHWNWRRTPTKGFFFSLCLWGPDNMNQHDYVKRCLAFYEEEGLVPGEGPGWEDAHYPAPEGKGDTTVPMLHDNHQVQGLWQSKEYNQCCFFIGHAKRFLTEGPFVSGWFELWDIFDEISAMHLSAAGSLGGVKAVELGVGAHSPGMASRGGKIGSREGKSEGGKVGGKTAVEEGLGIHSPGVKTSETCSKGSKNQPREAKVRGGKTGSQKTNSQRYMNTDSRFFAYVSTASGLTSWQTARGIDTSRRVKLE